MSDIGEQLNLSIQDMQPVYDQLMIAQASPTPPQTIPSSSASPFACFGSSRELLSKEFKDQEKTRTKIFSSRVIEEIIKQLSCVYSRAVNLKTQKLVSLWKHKTQTQKLFSLQQTYLLQTLKSKLSWLCKLQKQKKVSKYREVWGNWVLFVANTRKFKYLQALKSKRQQIHKAHVAKLTEKSNSLISKQAMLEETLSKQIVRDKRYQHTIEELSQQVPEVENQSEKELEELQRKNLQLREKIEAIENNANLFIMEMSGLLEAQQELQENRESSNRTHRFTISLVNQR